MTATGVASAEGTSPGNGMFRSFAYPNYRIYAAGSIVSNVGTWMQRVAQDWLVLKLTGSSADLGIVVAIQFLSILVVAPTAGTLVDRYSKRALIGGANVFMGVCALVLGLLVVSGHAQLWLVFVLAFALGAGSAVDNPARQAFTSEMVRRDDLPNALALGGTIVYGARLVGPALAGGLIATSGTGSVFIVNAASFLAVVLSMAFMRSSLLLPFTRSTKENGTLLIGLRFLARRRDLILLLVIIGGSGVFALNLQLSVTLMATSTFHKGAGGFGLLTSILSIGSVTGGLLGARVRNPTPRLVAIFGTAFGLMFVVTAVMPTILLYGVALVPLGTLCMLTMMTCGSCFQLRLDSSLRGRLMGVYFAVMMGSTGLGALVLGALSARLGAPLALTAGGAATVVLVGIAGLALIRADAARRLALAGLGPAEH